MAKRFPGKRSKNSDFKTRLLNIEIGGAGGNALILLIRHRVFCCEIISVSSSILGVFACYVMIGCAVGYIMCNMLYTTY